MRRSAAGRAVDAGAGAVELAVIASVRHEDTPYDELLMTGVDRADARERVRADVDRILNHGVLVAPTACRPRLVFPAGFAGRGHPRERAVLTRAHGNRVSPVIERLLWNKD